MTPAATEEALTLVVGTGNRHKLAEVAAALAGLRFGGRPLRVEGTDALPTGDPVEETGATFMENARIKSRAYALLASSLPTGRRPRWILADDSGLAVDALRGAPGVRSARYAGEDAKDHDNNRKLLAALVGVPRERRGAEFVCALSLVEVPGDEGKKPREIVTAEGRCRGEILLEERGAGGFGYDPLFLVPSLGKTFAELSQKEKNELSHRGRALKALREKLGLLSASS